MMHVRYFVGDYAETWLQIHLDPLKREDAWLAEDDASY